MKVVLSVAGTLSLLVVAISAQDCGRTPIEPTTDGRIVNGVEARPNSWPFTAAVCANTASTLACRFFCGASIISNRYILTAAHCLQGRSGANSAFKIGAHSLESVENNGQQMVAIEQIFIHPDYDTGSRNIIADISVVRLVEAIQYNDQIQPICLSNTEEHLTPNLPMVNVGWGSMRSGMNGPYPDKLQQVSLAYHPRGTCNRMFFLIGAGFMPNDVICGAGEADGKSVCFGDSGGPWFHKDEQNNRIYQYGINAFVFDDECAQRGQPNGFVRISYYCDYIAEHAGEELCAAPPSSVGLKAKQRLANIFNKIKV